MPYDKTLSVLLSAETFLEYAFLRWVLTPAVRSEAVKYIVPQQEVVFDGHTYRVDYAIKGREFRIAVELDGFEFHGTRGAFTYDRLR